METGRHSLARATIVIMLISTLGKVLGFVREQVIASQYGATGMVDAYVTALTVPNLLVAILGGAIGMAFLPVFSNYMAQNDRVSAWSLLGIVFRSTIILLIGVSVLGFLGAPLITDILVPSFTAEQRSLTVDMLRIMMPGTVFLGLAALFTSLLNSFKQFGWPAVAPLCMNIATIGLALLLESRLGVVGLAWATLIGMGMQLTLLAWRIKTNGFSLLSKDTLSHPGIRLVGSLAGPIVVSTLFAQAYLLVDKSLASGLDAGSIASLNYAFKLVQLPIGIFVTALATAIYPTLADFAGSGNEAGISKTVSSGMRIVAMIMLPASIGLIVLREPIVRLAFERGSFGATATMQTATALAFYAIGLLGVAGVTVLARAFYSMQDSLTPVKVSVGASLLNIILALVLVKQLGHGGLALAYSVAMLTNMVLLLILLGMKLKVQLDFLEPVTKIAVASAAMGVVVKFLHPLMQDFGSMIALLGAVLLGISVYGLLLVLLRVQEITNLMVALKKRVAPGSQGNIEDAA